MQKIVTEPTLDISDQDPPTCYSNHLPPPSVDGPPPSCQVSMVVISEGQGASVGEHVRLGWKDRCEEESQGGWSRVDPVHELHVHVHPHMGVH